MLGPSDEVDVSEDISNNIILMTMLNMKVEPAPWSLSQGCLGRGTVEGRHTFIITIMMMMMMMMMAAPLHHAPKCSKT